MVDRIAKLPVKPRLKIKDEIGINLSVLTFHWGLKEFVNIDTGNIEKAEAWEFANGSADLSKPLSMGVFPIIDGRRSAKRIYGLEAMAYVLSKLDCKCTVEQAKELVESAKKQQIRFGKLLRKSDMIPTSPQLYDESINGPNEWLLISNSDTLFDTLNANLNENLKLAGSPLRVKGALKYKMVE